MVKDLDQQFQFLMLLKGSRRRLGIKQQPQEVQYFCFNSNGVVAAIDLLESISNDYNNDGASMQPGYLYTMQNYTLVYAVRCFENLHELDSNDDNHNGQRGEG